MSDHGPASAEASTEIAADPATVYALITDLPTLATLAEEVNTMEWHRGDRVERGAVFKGRNQAGTKKWTTSCTVTHAEPGRTFAFDVKSLVFPVAHWRYDISATDGGCTVTERTWDKRPGWFRTPAGIATGVRDRDSANAEHIKLTLQRLKEKAEASG
jgi:hypothetical protein